MSPLVVCITQERKLDDGAEGVEHFLEGDRMPLGDHGKGEELLAGFGYVYYSDTDYEMILIWSGERKLTDLA